MESTRLGFSSHSLEFVRFLGRGAFGEVSLAKVIPQLQHDGLAEAGTYVALKRVPVLQLSQTGTAKALAEARLLKELASESNCILRCFDFRIVSGSSPVLELLLEFAPLGDLSRRIKIQKDESAEELGLAEAETVAFGRDIANGLAYLHSLRPKVFHRDVKPANVVLFPHDAALGIASRLHAKLADFGIAKLLEEEGSFAGAATVVGTPHYFSPELCRGQAYDERADAWALGCVLYEMMCLHRPFHKVESNIALLAVSISEGKYDREALSRRAKRYNGLLIFTLTELLATEPSQRQRARDALSALDSCLSEVESSIVGVKFAEDHALDITPEGVDHSGPGVGSDATDSWLPMGEDGTRLPSNLGTPLGDAMRVLRSAAETLAPQGENGPDLQVLAEEHDNLQTTQPIPSESDGNESVEGTKVPDTVVGISAAATIDMREETCVFEQGDQACGSQTVAPATEDAAEPAAVDMLLETQYLDGARDEQADPQVGAPSRQAWGGAMEFDREDVFNPAGEQQPVEACEPMAEDMPQRPISRGGRLFMRPLRRDRGDPFEGPVIMCFKPDRVGPAEVPAQGDGLGPGSPEQTLPDQAPADNCADACKASASNGPPTGSDEWLQVVIPGGAGGLFSLTAVE